MKNPTLNNTGININNMLKSALFAFLLVASIIPSVAHATEVKLEKETPFEVKYLGQVDNQPIFQMNIDNLKSDDLYVTLKDEEGNTLYGEKIRDRKFSKKFQFANREAGDFKVTLSVTSKKEKKSQVFEISNVSKVVEDVVVTEAR